MSKIVKGVKKVFKTVAKVVKKVWKPLAIAAAVYFTAGLAASAFAPASAAISTSAAASTGVLASGAGAAAAGGGSILAGAGGIFGATGVASAAGAGAAVAGSGVLTAGALAAGASAAAPAIMPGIFTKMATAVANAGKAVVGVGKNVLGLGGTGTAASGGTGFFGAMTGAEKLQFASTMFGTVGAALKKDDPSLSQQAEEAKRFRGSYFGATAQYDKKGNVTGEQQTNIVGGAVDAMNKQAEQFAAMKPERAPPPQQVLSMDDLMNPETAAYGVMG